MRMQRVVLCLAGLAGATAVTAVAPAPIAPEQFDRLHALIQPSSGEDKWTEIPWQARLREAQRQAAAQGKSILIWAMDGSPLGCG
jgi:hypothetical protein